MPRNSELGEEAFALYCELSSNHGQAYESRAVASKPRDSSFFRHHGFLSRVWPRFVQRHERFHVANPRSEAMQSFLKKIGYFEAIPPSA